VARARGTPRRRAVPLPGRAPPPPPSAPPPPPPRTPSPPAPQLVRQLKAKGYDVIGACRKASPELAATGATVLEGVDVGDDACMPLLRRATAGQTLDVVVANAGILRAEPAGYAAMPDYFGDMKEQFNVNTLGPLRCVRAPGPRPGHLTLTGPRACDPPPHAHTHTSPRPRSTVHAVDASLKSGSKVAIITSRVGSIADNGGGGVTGYRCSKTAVNMAGKNLR